MSSALFLKYNPTSSVIMRSLLLTFLLFCYLEQPLAKNVERLALVIGNQNYQAAPLKHSLNDAIAIADALGELGFVVSLVTDADIEALHQDINDFYHQVSLSKAPQKLAVVYYAGHAIQVNNSNYLIPLNLEFDSQKSFIGGLYKLSNLFSHMNKVSGLQNIVILDACRNNPFEGMTQEDISSGLAPVRAPSGTLIAFATEPGGVASDGSSKNGVYTKHLLRFMSKSLPVEEIFKKVRTDVARDTRNKQIPWEHSSLLQEVYFSPPKNKDVPSIVAF